MPFWMQKQHFFMGGILLWVLWRLKPKKSKVAFSGLSCQPYNLENCPQKMKRKIKMKGLAGYPVWPDICPDTGY